MSMQNIFLDQQYWRKILKLSEKEIPSELVVYASMFHSKILPVFEEYATIKKETGLPKIFLASTKEGENFLGGTVYAPAEAATVAHLAGVLNFKKMTLVGSCGGLGSKSNPVLLPETATREDKVSDWYLDDDSSARADSQLLPDIKKAMEEKGLEYDTGKVVTINHMLMEKEDDIKRWKSSKNDGVDMETASFYAVANYFNIPAAALLTKTEHLDEKEVKPISPEEKRSLRDHLLETAIKRK